MMTKKQLSELLANTCAKSARKVIYSTGKELVYVCYEKKVPVLTTTVNEE